MTLLDQCFSELHFHSQILFHLHIWHDTISMNSITLLEILWLKQTQLHVTSQHTYSIDVFLSHPSHSLSFSHSNILLFYQITIDIKTILILIIFHTHFNTLFLFHSIFPPLSILPIFILHSITIMNILQYLQMVVVDAHPVF